MNNIVTNIFFNYSSTSNWISYVTDIVSSEMNTIFNNINSNINDFNTFGEEIVKAVSAEPNKLCVGLKIERIKHSVSNSDVIICVKNESNKIIGFTTLKILGDSQTLYVDVICANSDNKGIGSYIMDLVTTIAEKSSLSEIKLDSVTNSVGFYIKKGFSCDKLCKMKKTVQGVNSYSYGGSRRKVKGKKSKRNRKIRRRTYKR